MTQSHFSLTWESYKSSICTGFSSLQQNGEFVDMTLAADGHLVKVHQALIALSSPYLKNIISSVPSQHPVIFLYNISHATLCFLLEYIYTGQVLVPTKNLESFIQAAKALHIKGLHQVGLGCLPYEHRIVLRKDAAPCIDPPRKVPFALIEPLKNELDLMERMQIIQKVSKPTLWVLQQNPAAAINTASDVDMFDDNVKSGVQEPDKQLQTSASPARLTNQRKRISPRPSIVGQGFTSEDEDTVTAAGDAGFTDDDGGVADGGATDGGAGGRGAADGGVGGGGAGGAGLKGALQFAVSNRGSVQVVFNRFMYNLHSARTGGERRWRCLGYRPRRGAERCPAYIITQDDSVLRRVNLHNHPFHDKKILEKVKKNLVFGALDQVENYNNSEVTETKTAIEPTS